MLADLARLLQNVNVLFANLRVRIGRIVRVDPITGVPKVENVE